MTIAESGSYHDMALHKETIYNQSSAGVVLRQVVRARYLQRGGLVAAAEILRCRGVEVVGGGGRGES